MNPINTPHAYCVSMLNRIFTKHLPEKYFISVQNPVQLSEHSLPQPDLVVDHYQEGVYDKKHIQASDVILLIEVSDSTYGYDRDTKLKAYATDGIHEYWIVNIADRHIEVYTQPESDYCKQIVIQKQAFTTLLGFDLHLDSLFS